MFIPAKKIYPRTGDKQTVCLDAVVKAPGISAATYTMYNDFVNDPQIKQLLPLIKRGDANALLKAYRKL